jgi:putative nucleotidyltransferase with HDIG domain
MPTVYESFDAVTNRPLGRGPALKRLFARISDMSSLAMGAQQIVRLCRGSSNLEHLQELIQTDPSLVAQILRRVNSSYYQLDTHVHDLTVAARLLGFREFSNLALTVYFSRMYSPPMSFGTFNMAGLWAHSVAVAAAAQLVSRVCGCAAPAEAYLAGLLHDIGLLLCCKQMRRRFMQVVEQVQGRRMTSHVERQVYSFDHAQLGAHVARNWEFPEPIVDTIEHHHDVESYTGPHASLVYVIVAANYFCSRAGWTSLGVHNVALPPDDTYRVLGLDQVALSIIWDELSVTLEKAAALAQL